MRSGVAWEQQRTGHLITNALLLALIVNVIMINVFFLTITMLVRRYDAGSGFRNCVVHASIVPF